MPNLFFDARGRLEIPRPQGHHLRMSRRSLQNQKAAPAVLALVETMFGLLIHALTRFVTGDAKPRYNPARYYMRGPGPKWTEKHGGVPARSYLKPCA